jgi:hypothetical protein
MSARRRYFTGNFISHIFNPRVFSNRPVEEACIELANCFDIAQLRLSHTNHPLPNATYHACQQSAQFSLLEFGNLPPDTRTYFMMVEYNVVGNAGIEGNAGRNSILIDLLIQLN